VLWSGDETQGKEKIVWGIWTGRTISRPDLNQKKLIRPYQEGEY